MEVCVTLPPLRFFIQIHYILTKPPSLGSLALWKHNLEKLYLMTKQISTEKYQVEHYAKSCKLNQ